MKNRKLRTFTAFLIIFCLLFTNVSTSMATIADSTDLAGETLVVTEDTTDLVEEEPVSSTIEASQDSAAPIEETIVVEELAAIEDQQTILPVEDNLEAPLVNTSVEASEQPSETVQVTNPQVNLSSLEIVTSVQN